MPNNQKILFFGTSHFAVPILSALASSADFKPDVVITQPDAPVGRKKIILPTPVKLCALEFGLDLYQPETLKTEETVQRIAGADSVVCILAAYGKIIPERMLDLPRLGFLNIHPSLLPKLRGASPIQGTILLGEKETGTTIIQMDTEVDHGPIVAQEKISLAGKETYEMLSEKLSKISADLLLKTLPSYIRSDCLPRAQNHSNATFTKIITQQNAHVDWSKPAVEIERMIRAYHLWPNAHAYWTIGASDQSLRINLLAARIIPSNKQANPGTVFEIDSAIGIETGNGALMIDKLQLAGRKPADGSSFLRGHRMIIGSRLH